MTRWTVLITLCLSFAIQAQQIDTDGFKNPLQTLTFSNETNYVFERTHLDATHIYDPLESFNRYIYYFNANFDEYVFLPVTDGYKKITPTFMQRGVSNFFSNLGDVTNLANSLLQFKIKRSATITARLMFNTVFGVAGLWNPATRMGLPKQVEDFGQTLGFYKVPAGPYLVLPLLGPSNLRDATGKFVDASMSNYINYLGVAEESNRHPYIYGLQVIDLRATTGFRYGSLNSPFEYEKIRYIYTKARELQINE